MLRPTDDAPRRIEKLTRINAALIQRLDRLDDIRGSSYALTRTAAMLEREVVARNADLERALAELSASNAELAAARETADEANRAKSRFLRAASHDLLQPLSAGRLLIGQLGELATDAVQADLVERVTGSFESAEELIRALLDIARLDSQAFEANPGPVAIGRLFQRLTVDLQPLAGARGIDLRFVMSSAVVLSDPVLLRQIAQNLIINALKYSTGPKVVVGLKHDGDAAWLTVQDSGRASTPTTRSGSSTSSSGCRCRTCRGAGSGCRSFGGPASSSGTRSRSTARPVTARASGCGCRWSSARWPRHRRCRGCRRPGPTSSGGAS